MGLISIWTIENHEISIHLRVSFPVCQNTKQSLHIRGSIYKWILVLLLLLVHSLECSARKCNSFTIALSLGAYLRVLRKSSWAASVYPTPSQFLCLHVLWRQSNCESFEGYSKDQHNWLKSFEGYSKDQHIHIYWTLIIDRQSNSKIIIIKIK